MNFRSDPNATTAAERAPRHVAARSAGARGGPRAAAGSQLPSRPARRRRPVLEAPAADGAYRSQFVTGTSNGGLTAQPGGDRRRWKSRIFGGAYDTAPATGVRGAEPPASGGGRGATLRLLPLPADPPTRWSGPRSATRTVRPSGPLPGWPGDGSDRARRGGRPGRPRRLHRSACARSCRAGTARAGPEVLDASYRATPVEAAGSPARWNGTPGTGSPSPSCAAIRTSAVRSTSSRVRTSPWGDTSTRGSPVTPCARAGTTRRT